VYPAAIAPTAMIKNAKTSLRFERINIITINITSGIIYLD
jgi:hypothetical protein